MADPSGNRLTAVTADNHQPWLWFLQVFSCACIAGAGGLRFWIKRKHFGNSDVIVLIAHVVYISYWITLLFALLNGLGKSDRLASPAEEDKASKLVFSSRIIFVLVINLAKLGTIFLIQEIFTKDATKWWFRAIVLVTICETFIGSLMISAGCSPGRVLLAGDEAHCSGNSARWIVFTIFESALELALATPVVIIVSRLQTKLPNKIFTFSVFLCRLVIWIPEFMHVVFYARFSLNGRDNIDLVPVIAMEMLWVTLSLVSASMPALMRIAKRFTTTGVTVRTMHSTSKSASRTKEVTHQLSNFSKNRTLARASKVDPSDNIESSGHHNFRPDQGIYSISIDAAKREAEGASIGSTAESHVGILKQVDFQVSYEASQEKNDESK